MARTVSLLACLAGPATLLAIACTFDEPIAAKPSLALVESSGTQLLNNSSCFAPTADGGTFRANGTDVMLLELATAGGGKAMTTGYSVELTSPDGRLGFRATGSPADAGSESPASSVIVPISLSSQKDIVSVHARFESGDARILLRTGGVVAMYCLHLESSAPASLQLRATSSPEDATPAGWTSFDLAATLLARDGASVSDGARVEWTAGDCAYVAAAETAARGGRATSNVLYAPPGWLRASVDATVLGTGIKRRLCLTPAGGAMDSDGGLCPQVVRTFGDAGEPEGSTTIVCPPR